MKRTVLIITAVATALALTGCAQLQKQWQEQEAQMAQQQAAARAAAAKRAAEQKKIDCTTNGAYANGLNAARTNKPMSANYAGQCDAKIQTQINTSYKQGYQAGVNARPIAPPTPAKPVHHRAKWECIANNNMKNVCGYHCIKNNWGDVVCAKYRHDNCVKNDFGDMACGEHCTVNPDTTLSCEKQTSSVNKTSTAHKTTHHPLMGGHSFFSPFGKK